MKLIVPLRLSTPRGISIIMRYLVVRKYQEKVALIEKECYNTLLWVSCILYTERKYRNDLLGENE